MFCRSGKRFGNHENWLVRGEILWIRMAGDVLSGLADL